MSSSTNVIYALSLDGQDYKYVGHTSRGAEKRLKEHVAEAVHDTRRPLYGWMRKYGPSNVRITVLEEVEKITNLQFRETDWIEKLSADGYKLLNLTHCSGKRKRRPIVGYLEPINDVDRRTDSLVAYHNRVVAKALEEDY